MILQKLEFSCFFDHSKQELVIDVVDDELKSLVRLVPVEVKVEKNGEVYTRRIFEVYLRPFAQGNTSNNVYYSIVFKKLDSAVERCFSVVSRTTKQSSDEKAVDLGLRWRALNREGDPVDWESSLGYPSSIAAYRSEPASATASLDFYVEFAPEHGLENSYGYQLNLLSLGAPSLGKRPPITKPPDGGEPDNGSQFPEPTFDWVDPTTDAKPAAPEPKEESLPGNVTLKPGPGGITINIATAHITVYPGVGDPSPRTS